MTSIPKSREAALDELLVLDKELILKLERLAELKSFILGHEVVRSASPASGRNGSYSPPGITQQRILEIMRGREPMMPKDVMSYGLTENQVYAALKKLVRSNFLRKVNGAYELIVKPDSSRGDS